MAKKYSLQTQTGIARPASSVLLAPARAVSSHARRLYSERYLGRYRFAPLVFLFDAFLAGIALCLLGINIFLWILSNPKASGLEAEIYAPVIVASQTMPIEVVIKSVDGRVHRDVTLTWEFAPSTEIEMMSPQAGIFGTIKLGDISPFGEARAKARIQVHAEVGSKVPLRFRLTEGMWGSVVQGGAVRQVESGALQANPALTAQAVFPGAAIPLRIKNTGKEQTDAFTLRLIRKSGAEASLGNDGTMVQIDKLAAGAEQIVGIQLGTELSDSIQLAWQLEQHGRIIYRKSGIWSRAIGEAPQFTVQTKEQGIEIQGDTKTDAKVLGAKNEFKLKQNQSLLIDPLQAALGDIIFPYIQSGELSQLAPPIRLPIPIHLPFEAEARYYSATGDQLGIGPHPPQEGEITSYWVFWRVGPVNQDLKDLRIQAKLAPGIERTGAFTASLGGNASANKNEIDWRFPRLEAGTTAELGLEIQVEPKTEQVGSILPLVSTSTIEGLSVKNWAYPLTTLLEKDIRAKSSGIVQSKTNE